MHTKCKKRHDIIGSVILALLIVLVIIIVKAYGNRQHKYYCDKFLLTVDNKQIDLQEVAPQIQSVSELLPITNQEIAIVCRIDADTNELLIYSFRKKDFVFQEQGIMFAWVQDDFDSTLYLKEDAVYTLDGTEIYRADTASHIAVMEYIGSEFYVTLADENYENQEQVKVPVEE